MGLCPTDISPQGPAPAPGMSAAAVTAVALLLLTRPHRLLLCRCDYRIDLLPFRLDRERRVRANRFNFLARLLGNGSTLLQRGFGNARDLVENP